MPNESISRIVDLLMQQKRSQPGPMDYAAGLLADNAGTFTRTEPPVLFQDTPLAGSTPTHSDIMRQWAQRAPSPQYDYFLKGGGSI